MGLLDPSPAVGLIVQGLLHEPEGGEQALGSTGSFDPPALTVSTFLYSSFLIPQSFSSHSSLHLFPFLLPSSPLLLCVFRRTKYSFPSLSRLSVYCSQLAPVKHIQEDSFFFLLFGFFLPSLEEFEMQEYKSFLLYHFTNVRGICEMKLAGNKDETEVLSAIAFYVLVVN